MNKIKMIACVNNTLSLGDNGKLLYRIKDDLINFKNKTKNNVVVMGRKTYESLPIKPLPNRINIVISSNKQYAAKDCEVVASVAEAIELYRNKYSNLDLFVIGGGQIYKSFFDLNVVDEINLTLVNRNDESITKFPDVFNCDNWQMCHKSEKMISSDNNLEYYFLDFKKI